MVRLALIFALIMSGGSFAVNPVAIEEPPLVKIGAGKYTWFGIKVYDAELYASPNFSGDFKSSAPLSLQIKYDMNIDKDDLIETTLEEWEDIEIGQSTQCQNKVLWSEELAKIWPDLKQGDQLKLLVKNNRESVFFHNSNEIGTIVDPQFSTCFLAIWLAEDTNASDLREKLLSLQR